MWFRGPQKRVRTWAGDQRQPNQIVESKADEPFKLSPRASFEKWEQAIGDQSTRWNKTDVAMVERIQRELLNKEHDLTTTLLERSNREFREELTFAAAHDLQAPLRTQLTYLQVLEEDFGSDISPRAEKYLQNSKIAVHRMQNLLTDLLDYTKLGVETARTNVDLNQVFDAVAREFTYAIDQSGAKIERDELPTVVGDQSCYEQAFRNIIGNGVKYVAPGVSPIISVYATANKNYIEIRFSDNGIGLEEQEQEKVFRLYARLHHQKDYEGTGIGLAIAKRAIEAMDGTIGVNSKPGQGSVFWIRLNREAIAQ